MRFIANQREELQEIVEDLIYLHKEGDYWDFKERYDEDKAKLVHDILCLANQKENRDAYLIFGVVDKTFEIVGVETSSPRFDQKQITDILYSCSFTGGVLPDVEFQTLQYINHEIDVLVIKNSLSVPFTLSKDYSYINPHRSKPTCVKANAIYVRKKDQNTGFDKTASLADVEALWKKHFYLNQKPVQRITHYLLDPSEWEENSKGFFHTQFPEYTIETEWNRDWNRDDDHRNSAFYHYLMIDTSSKYGTLHVKDKGTEIHSFAITLLDGGRMTILCPSSKYLHFGPNSKDVICIKYLCGNSLEANLDLFLLAKESHGEFHSEAQIAFLQFLDVVVLFEQDEDPKEFFDYLENNSQIWDEELKKQKEPYVEESNETLKNKIISDIRNGRTAKTCYDRWVHDCDKQRNLATQV